MILTDFVSIRPRHEMEQGKLLEWTAATHAAACPASPHLKEKLLAFGTGTDKIKKRGFQIPDPLQDSSPVKSLAERMRFYEEEVSNLFETFYPADCALPEQLIHVTCTGYVAPSPAQKLLSKREAKQSFATHVYHMGCYASIPALRIAAGSLATGIASVDIVHTEMCSLHFHPFKQDTEQLIIQSLFADGFIKYSLQREKDQKEGLQCIALLEETLPDSLTCMQWRTEDVCFGMTLSKKVPLHITQSLEGFFSRLLEKARLNVETIRTSAYFAIHPGGTKIFHYVKETLGLEDWQVAHSLRVLQHYGNMSSATVPHIWEQMVHDIPIGAYVVSFAYGPGLTIAGAVLKRV